MRLLSYAILAFWLLALGRTILNLLLTPRLVARVPRRFPRVSVIIPARDEERTIERTVRAFLAQTYPALEIIVVNDRSVDRTGEILAEIGRIHVVNNEEPPAGWLGKPWALHQGSRRATGELLLFVDADVIYAPDTVMAAVARLETSEVALLALFPRLEMRGFWEHVVMPNLAVFAFTFLPLWLVNRTRIRLLAIGGGTGNLVRCEDYEAVNGHESLKDAVVDDVALARLMRRSGRTEAVRAEQWVTVRMYHGLGEIVRGFTKNAFAIFGYNYFVAALFLALGFVFHLLPFALALTGNVIAIVTVALIALSRVILFAAIGYRLDNAVLGHPLMIATWCWIVLRSIWITGIRRQLHWRGRTYDAGRTKFGAD
ncbi:MAG TPA: glycosyltransferase [Thermoanaerobaculia bacterium]|jgi:chlorobactene glucosyltransferase|nr:glycosyltransferase [Thermoanaerobaculia bacterium]